MLECHGHSYLHSKSGGSFSSRRLRSPDWSGSVMEENQFSVFLTLHERPLFYQVKREINLMLRETSVGNMNLSYLHETHLDTHLFINNSPAFL